MNKSIAFGGRACPVCNGNDGEVLHTQCLVTFEDSGFPDCFDVVACAKCGMVYSDVALGQPKLDEGYAQRSKYIVPPIASDLERRRQEQTAKTILSLVGRKDAHILDVGCATGSLLKALHEQGCICLTGMDPSTACLDVVRDTVPRCCQIKGSLFSEIQGIKGIADCVILSHVLEHIADVQGAFQAVTSLLAEGGIAYIEVPDATRYLECLTIPFQDFNTEHINHFSGRHLVAAAEKAGLQPFRGGCGFKTFPPAEGHLYPAVWVAFHKGATPCEVPANGLHYLKEEVRGYVEASARMWSIMERRLMVDLDGRQPIVWGTGELTYKLLAGELGKLGVLGFVDSNPIYTGRKLFGRHVMGIDGLKEFTIDEHQNGIDPAPILAAGILHQQSIVEAVRDLGLRNPVVTLKPNGAA